MTGEEELAVRQARGAADAARELLRWPEYDDLCLTCAGRGWIDLLPLTRAPGTGPREDCRDCGGTGKAPQ